MRPVIWTACRRSLGLYFVPAFLLVEAVDVLAHGQGWTITWESASQTGATIMMLLGPLAAAVAAAEGVELHRRGTAFVTGDTTRSWRYGLLRFAGVSFWSLGSHLIGLAVIWLMTAMQHGSAGSLDWIATAVSVEVLLAHVAVGVAVGTLIPRLLTPPALAVVLYALAPWLGVPFRLVVADAGMTSMLGLQPRRDLLAAQAVWFACVALAALLVSGRFHPGRAVLAVAMVAVSAYAASAATGLGATTLEPQKHPDLICAGSSPRVCASADVPGSLGPLRRVARPLAKASRGLSPGHPIDTVIGLSWIEPRPGTASVGVNTHEPYVDTGDAAAGFASSIAGCWEYVPDRSEHDLDVTVRYLLHTAGLPNDEAVGTAKRRHPTLAQARHALDRLKAVCR